MQWHPLFAKLVRPLLEGYYEVQTNVPVGDAPREADLVLLRRTSSHVTPFQGLWKHLAPWNVLEYKGPTVSARLKDLPLLVELGLGICRRFDEERRKQKQSRLSPRDVSFWYLANHLGGRFLRNAESLLRGLDAVGPGLWRSRELGHALYLVSSNKLPVELDSLPLHVLSRVPKATRRAVAQLIVDQPALWPTLGEFFASLHPETIEELLVMSKTAREFKFHWKALVQLHGKEEIIRGLPGMIAEVGPAGLERVIEKVGKKKILQHMSVDDVLANFSAEERKELKRRLAD